MEGCAVLGKMQEGLHAATSQVKGTMEQGLHGAGEQGASEMGQALGRPVIGIGTAQRFCASRPQGLVRCIFIFRPLEQQHATLVGTLHIPP